MGWGSEGGECCFIRETRKFQRVYQSAKERRGGEDRGKREGEEEIESRIKWAGCEKRSSSWSLFRKGPPLSCWVLLSSCPPGTMLVEQLPPPPPSHVPPTALHVLELRWQPGPQTSTYGGQTKRPALQCAPQLGLCWNGQRSFMQPHALYWLSSPTMLNLKIGKHIFSFTSIDVRPCKLKFKALFILDDWMD